jgi:hypothetical protein
MKYFAALILVLVVLLPSGALAARLALVIGINDYEYVPKLEKAVGDAEAMAAKLTAIGFTVTPVLNPDRRTLSQAISVFQRQIRPGDDILVHFSGHGVEIDGSNLLLPADVPMPGTDDKDFLIGEAIGLSDLMQRISDTKAATKVFIIDACRDNPFVIGGRRSLGGTRGLTIAAPTKGSFIFYSAGQGQTALDRLGPADPVPTSVYTRVLVDQLGTPGMSLTELAKTVRRKVAKLAGQVSHEQQPAYYDELSDDDFAFVEANSPNLSPTPDPMLSSTVDATRVAYEEAKSINSAEAWGVFLKYHPDGYYADLARAAIDNLSLDFALLNVSVDEVIELVSRISADDAASNIAESVAKNYADQIVYYGKIVSRAEVLADKKSWYARWSSWSVQPHYDTLKVQPSNDGRFEVSYLLDYQWNSASGREPLLGTAQAQMTVVKVDGRLVIVEENSKVLSERSQPADLASLGPFVLGMPDVDGNYFVFLGTFKARSGAEAQLRQVGALGRQAKIIRTSDHIALTSNLWALAVGPLRREAAAEALAAARVDVPDAYIRQTRHKDQAPASNNVHYLVGLLPTGDNWLALRAEPSTSGTLLAKLGAATLLRVISQTGGWNEVEVLNTTLRGTRGWASRKYISCCL